MPTLSFGSPGDGNAELSVARRHRRMATVERCKETVEHLWKAVSDVASGALHVVIFTRRRQGVDNRSGQGPIQKRDLDFLLHVVDNNQWKSSFSTTRSRDDHCKEQPLAGTMLNLIDIRIHRTAFLLGAVGKVIYH